MEGEETDRCNEGYETKLVVHPSIPIQIRAEDVLHTSREGHYIHQVIHRLLLHDWRELLTRYQRRSSLATASVG